MFSWSVIRNAELEIATIATSQLRNCNNTVAIFISVFNTMLRISQQFSKIQKEILRIKIYRLCKLIVWSAYLNKVRLFLFFRKAKFPHRFLTFHIGYPSKGWKRPCIHTTCFPHSSPNTRRPAWPGAI